MAANFEGFKQSSGIRIVTIGHFFLLFSLVIDIVDVT